MVERVNYKLIQSGDITEVYTYEKGYLKGFTVKNNGGSSQTEKIEDDEVTKTENRERALRRAKQGLRRTINSNFEQYGEKITSKFLTLTFTENIQDIENANYEFKKFIKRLNYQVFNSKKAVLKYTCVIEFQERGAIHYHIVLYNMPFVKWDVILEIWRNGANTGGIFINKIDNVDNVGAYVAEYLGSQDKDQGRNIADDRLQGKKSYFSSRGLLKPKEITNKKVIENIVNALPKENLVYSAEFENEHLGFTTYKQYNLNRKVESKK